LPEAHIVDLEPAGKGRGKEKLNLCKYLPTLTPFLYEGRLDWARLPTINSTIGLMTGHNRYLQLAKVVLD
jgi:hypothetical protein